MGFAQLRLSFGENMLGFAQISWVLLIFVPDFLLRSHEFGANPVTIWWLLLKSREFGINPVMIWFFLLRSSSFTQIQWRSGKKYRSPPNKILRQHFVDFDRLDRQSFQSIQPKLLVFAIDGRLSRRKPDVIGSVAGWAHTRPRPTHGHPYLCHCTLAKKEGGEFADILWKICKVVISN